MYGFMRVNVRTYFGIDSQLYKKEKAIHPGQPISIVNLKSNTMKNTMQI